MFGMKKWFSLFLIIFSMLFLHAFVKDSKMQEKEALFREVVEAYKQYGNEKYMIEEEVTQADHVLQAAFIADHAGAPEDVVIGLLLHDIGQICQSEYVGDLHVLHPFHDDIGAKWADEKGFPPFIADLLRNHTLVKILMCENDPKYYHSLSKASKTSYHFQKEKFNSPEYQKRNDQLFSHPRKEDLCSARKCDDMAKIVGFSAAKGNPHHLPDFPYYKEMLFRVQSDQGRDGSNPNWRKTIDHMHKKMVEDRSSFESSITLSR